MPASDVTVARYAAFLARRLKPSSVKQYLNIIRLLHLECNLDNPCADSWYLKTTIKGTEKVKGTEVIRKLPMKPELLLQIKEKLKFCKTVCSGPPAWRWFMDCCGNQTSLVPTVEGFTPTDS